MNVSRRARPRGRASKRFASIVGLALVVAAVSACGGSAGDSPAGDSPAAGGSGGREPAVAIMGTIVFATPVKGVHADLYLLDAHGTRRLASDAFLNNAYPAWSPDGTQIAYITDKWQLAVIRRDGSGGATLTPETSDPSLWPTRPAWLPDGNISFFVGGKLAVLRPDGSGVRVLTPSNPKARTPGFSGAFAWSPDGTQIVFDCSISAFDPEVCLFDVKTGKSRMLLEPPRPFYAFAWSPDGKKILAGDWSGASEGVGDAQEDVYVFDAKGEGLRALAQPGHEENPAWSPDGARIVYGSFTRDSDSGSSHDLWVMSADGSGAQKLTSGITAVQPDWTAD